MSFVFDNYSGSSQFAILKLKTAPIKPRDNKGSDDTDRSFVFSIMNYFKLR